MIEIIFSKKAKNDFDCLPVREKKLVSKKILLLQNNYSILRIKKIVNTKNYFRLRAGNFRIVFEKEGDLLKIFRIRHCNEIYKKFF